MKSWRFYISVIWVITLSLGCTKPTPSTSDIPQKKNQLIEISQHLADSLWAGRQDPDNALDALYAYEYLASQDSTALPVWAKLVHAYYFNADFVRWQDSILRDSLFAEGYNMTRQILGQSKTYQSVLSSSGDPKLAVQSLGPEYNQVLYWGTVCLAKWAATKGEIVQRGQRPWIMAVINHINALDANFYYGAYDRFMGAMLCVDPLADENAPLRARQHFEKSIAKAPEYLGTYTLMAQYYARRTKDENLFYQLLTRVVTSVVDERSPIGPENFYEKKRAENLLLQAKQEGWFTP
ncbi:MAG: TRAP transporter TatT component family protein [Candidatus Marinimicrobia bacterium]|nr:TRAP transporter TatT component family protein [Candidatus Neomarinimicrobiota bacterium]MCF7840059.1 TRAP transporter TatT component family protein [Candidatus Neomarinimicrobiota bacterium]MCF7902419.1 TRAP transporter TatT component family protein [Candidatus Neomarinimicrobiota bacterium]